MFSESRPFTASHNKLAYAQAFSRADAVRRTTAAGARRQHLVARLLHRHS